MRFLPASTTATLSCLALAACVPAPEPTPPPVPAPAPAPAPSPAPTMPPFAGNWMDAPLTPGDWSYVVGPGDTTVARFGESPGRPRFTMSCYQPSQVITLSRYEGRPLAPVPMRIVTETHEGILATRSGEPGGFQMAEVAARDPLLDAMAFSKGRFVVESSGLATLYIPSYPEVTRVIEDCR